MQSIGVRTTINPSSVAPRLFHIEKLWTSANPLKNMIARQISKIKPTVISTATKSPKDEFTQFAGS